MPADALSQLRVNPDWASLPLFDRTGWTRMAFGDFAESIGERAEPKDAAEEIYVGLEHLDSQSLHIQRWGKGSDVTGTKLRFRKGDIIFGRRRAYQRKLAVAEFDGICSAHAMVVRAKPERVLPEFLPFLMMSDRFMNRAVEISVGSLSPTINWTTLKLEQFNLPPLEQQRRIADLLSTCRGTLGLVTMTGSECRSLYEASVDRVFAGRSGSNRNEVVPLSDVATLQTGIAKGKRYDATTRTVELPYLRVANVQDGYIDVSELKTLAVPEPARRRYALATGDVVICEGGDFDQVGRGAVWRGQVPECLHQNHVFCLRPDPQKVLPDFLAMQLASSYGKRYFLSCAKKTSNLASINSTQVKAFPLQLPPLVEQHALVRDLARVGSLSLALLAHHRVLDAALHKLVDATT